MDQGHAVPAAATAQVSVFEPHHTTEIRYPAHNLHPNLDTGEQSYRYEPLNIRQRFEPLPLIRTLAVANHAFRSSKEETGLFSLTRATFKSTSQDIDDAMPQRANPMQSVEDLIEDMRLLTTTVGSTILRVVVTTTPHLARQGGSAEMIFVVLQTDCSGKDNQEDIGYSGGYWMSAAEIRSVDCSEEWFLNLLDALTSSSDRAYLHGRVHRLPAAPGFKPVRQLPFKEFINSIAKPRQATTAQFNEEENACPVCGDDFDSGDHRAMTLRCNAGHLLCYSCVLSWCQSKGPQGANCPQCRMPMIQDLSLIHI